MNPTLEIKVKIYRDAVHLFEEGKIYPAVVRMLRFRYEEHDGDLIETFVEKARNREWEEIKKQADQLEKQGLDLNAIKTQLQPMEADAEVFNYVIDDWYDIKELHREYLEQKTEEARDYSLKNLIFSVITLVVIGYFAGIAYTKDAPQLWRIIIFSLLGLSFINLVIVAAYRLKKYNQQKRGI